MTSGDDLLLGTDRRGRSGGRLLRVEMVEWPPGRQPVRAGQGRCRHGRPPGPPGESFTVGTPSDFTEGDLRGHFSWLSGERAWGLRLENSRSSLRSLEGTSIPVWILQGDAGTWVRHPERRRAPQAYNTDVSLVLPKGLKEGDQIRFGDNAEDRVAT